MPLLPVLRLPRLVGIEIAGNMSYKGMKRLFHCVGQKNGVSRQLGALEIQQAIQEEGQWLGLSTNMYLSLSFLFHSFPHSIFSFFRFVSFCLFA